MKRIFTLFIAFTMMLCLASCGGSKEVKVYKLTGATENVNTTLEIDGTKVTVKSVTTNTSSVSTVSQTTIMIGIIKDNGDGSHTLVFNQKGASATYVMKITGEGAEDLKNTYLEQINTLEDGPSKQFQLDLVNGKTVTIKYGDDYWNTMLGTAGLSVSVVLNEEDNTFVYAEDET